MHTQIPKNRISRRDFLQGVAMIAGTAALAACAPVAPQAGVPGAGSAAVQPITLNIWINWGGVWQEAIEQISADFSAKNPQFTVELLPGQSGTEGMTKFLASIAGGNPPHLFTSHASNGAMLTSRDVLLALDPYMTNSTVKVEDFFEEQLNFYQNDGSLYGLPSIEGAAGQAIIWNKAHFAEVGLDPEQAPKTHAEIAQFAEMLDQIDGAGNVVRLGIDPRDARGSSLLDWWFERKWYDPNTQQLNLTSENMAWGADWVTSFAKRIGPEKLTSYRQVYETYTGSPKSGFVQGAQSMIMSAYYVPGELAKNAPDLEAGYDWVPTLDNKKVTTIRGWFWVMPKGDPDPEAAWQYVEHATSVEASQTYYDVAGGWPSYKPFLEVADFSQYKGLDWFTNSPFAADEFYIAPALPISSDEIDDRINAGLDEMAFGRISAPELLERVQAETQKLVDQALAAQ